MLKNGVTHIYKKVSLSKNSETKISKLSQKIEKQAIIGNQCRLNTF
jgi:cytosine/adenosine deaminase-related metal-dependent hydrolase